MGSNNNHYIGIDVGTSSVRAGLFSHTGNLVKVSTRCIQTWNPKKDYYEQSSNDIWKSCCQAVRDITDSFDKTLVKGIGFDATCSLVVVGEDGCSLTVSPTDESECNVILWMDHRAKLEAAFINRHEPDVLKYTGGTMSLEMQIPKLMWLKKNKIETWRKAKYFFDLTDFLTWRATGDDSRSLCTVVCKWTYINGQDGVNKGWDEKFFSLVQLSDLLKNKAVKIGSSIKKPGETCGAGLLETVAEELGLLPGTAVSIGVIDAYAGGLGLLGSSAPNITRKPNARIGMICGTSTCHMLVSPHPLFVPGVWGPYYEAMVPYLWLNEAGQSATGKLIDYMIESHPASKFITEKADGKVHIQQYLNQLLKCMAASKGLKSPSQLTARLHIWPDFHGNRSPIADPSLLGMVSGLTLSSDEEDLAIKYLSVIQALAYGTRHIIETLESKGSQKILTSVMCGGLSKNELFVQTHADVLGMPVLLPNAPEPVLLGSAMLGSSAGGGYYILEDAVLSMAGESTVYLPNKQDERYHSKKYEVFLKMVKDQKAYNDLMAEFL